MRLRRTALAALLATGIVVPAAGTAAVAFAQPAPATATAAHQSSGKPNKTRKPVRTPFAGSGRVTAVDAEAGTVTLLAKGGTKDVRKRSVTVVVADTARITVNSRRSTLDAVTVGAKITVTGTRSAGVYSATRVQVSQKAAPVVTPSPTPTVSPSPSPTPDDDPTEAPEDESGDDSSV